MCVLVCPRGARHVLIREPIAKAAELAALAVPRQVIVSKGSAFGARWSPDGSRFVFSLVRSGSSHPNIYTMNVDGSDLWQVTHGAHKEEFPDLGLPKP
jgi:Tol biopolymer transport system component